MRSFRLGDDLLIRLPSAAAYLEAVAKEQEWLPRLAPHLPVPIPEPVGAGDPALGYPWPWSVYRWLEGEPALVAPIADQVRFARDVGEFLVALQAAPADGGPGPGTHNFFRGAPLDVYEGEAREGIRQLSPDERPRATGLLDVALASRWERAGVWLHGDVAPGNLLVREGRLSAVIDFGTSGVGDPACDLVLAWTFLTGAASEAFRQAARLDDDTWARARGWALWKAVITLDDPSSRTTLARLLAET